MVESAAQLRRKLGRTKGQCTWCGGPVPKGRRKWCSDDCVTDFLAQHDWTAKRRQVLRRDKGVCAVCGTDCEKLKRIWQAAKSAWEERKAVKEWLKGEGFHNPWFELWQADHMVPQADGGTHALENLRTLCVPCHEAVTAEWRRARSKRA